MALMGDFKGLVLDNRYTIERQLGSGGMGTVFLARLKGLERPVAIKILQNSELAERFLQEAVAMSRLNHPHIIDIWWIGKQPTFYYLVMRYIEGESLSERISRLGRIPFHEGLQICTQVISALKCCHENGILHRDLKPGNIMLDRWGAAFLMDFGLAKIVGRSDLTQTGHFIGTPEYSSPDQIMGSKSVDHRTDIYSLGAMMYEMFTGTKVFEGELYTVITKHLHEQPEPPSQRYPKIHPLLEQIIIKCLQKDPNERFNTMEDLRRVVDGLTHLPDPEEDDAEPLVPARTVLLASPQALAQRKADPSSSITKFEEKLQARNKGEILEWINSQVGAVIRLWGEEYPEPNDRIQSLIKVREGMELVFQAGAKIIEAKDPKLQELFGERAGMARQLSRLLERALSPEIQRSLSHTLSVARRSVEGADLLRPHVLLNHVYKGMVFWGAYATSKTDAEALKALFQLLVPGPQGDLQPIIMFPTYDAAQEDQDQTPLGHAAQMMRTAGLTSFFYGDDNLLREALLQFDYLRCTYLHLQKKKFLPYFKWRTSEEVYSRAASELLLHTGEWTPLFGKMPEHAFKSFSYFLTQRPGRNSMDGIARPPRSSPTLFQDRNRKR